MQRSFSLYLVDSRAAERRMDGGGLALYYFEYFASLVFAAMRTSAVGTDLFVTVRTLGKLRNGQGIVSATRGSATL